jgi:hypothetical protein
VKKVKDVGLQYVMELGLRPAKSSDQFYSMLRDKFGKETLDAVKKYISARGGDEESEEKHDNLAFYKLKNSSAELSLFISGGFDGDFIRQTCNYIASVADKYGDCTRILEVGCDCGILSCFLGRTFPTAQIVSVDQCEESIAVAKKLAQRLGVANITFRHADIYDCAEDKYDAIFSIRVMHEARLSSVVEDHTLLMDTQADMFAAATAGYAETLSNKLTENGLLISIERCGINPLLYGWMLALNEQGFVASNYAQFTCEGPGDNNEFQVLEMQKENDSLPRENILRQFTTCFFGDKLELTEVDFYGWEASIVLQNMYGDLMDGVFAYVDGQKVGKLAIWKSASCETDILIEQYISGQCWILSVRDIAMLEEITQQISDNKENLRKAWRATFKPFKVVDGKEVEI